MDRGTRRTPWCRYSPTGYQGENRLDTKKAAPEHLRSHRGYDGRDKMAKACRWVAGDRGSRDEQNVTFLKEGQEMETVIRQLDKPTVTYIRKRLKAAVKPLAKELGVMIDLGHRTFQASNCRFQLKVAVLDSKGKAITEEADSFRSNAKLFGFEPSDLGREFIFQGQPYTICGFKPKSRKYPVIAQSGNCKDYKFACRTVLEALGREVPDWL